jgi:hypothetical protein
VKPAAVIQILFVVLIDFVAITLRENTSIKESNKIFISAASLIKTFHRKASFLVIS